MDFSIALFVVALVVFLLNIPFGYWRANVRKFSLQWVLAIHIPVPVIILLRIASGIGFHWFTYLVLMAAFFLGQYSGQKIYIWKRLHRHSVSSCIFVDIFRS